MSKASKLGPKRRNLQWRTRRQNNISNPIDEYQGKSNEQKESTNAKHEVMEQNTTNTNSHLEPKTIAMMTCQKPNDHQRDLQMCVCECAVCECVCIGLCVCVEC